MAQGPKGKCDAAVGVTLWNTLLPPGESLVHRAEDRQHVFGANSYLPARAQANLEHVVDRLDFPSQ